MKLECPFQPVEIPDDREVVFVDSLNFPWIQDPKGYFLVKIENGMVCCGFVNLKHVMEVEFRAKNVDNIIKEIAKRKLANLTHMGYIAQELQIAKQCLDTGRKYVQR